jgi:hypothetical protein
MILNRIELGTECTVRESGNKGVLKKIYFYPTKYEIEFPNGSVEHYSSKDIDFQGITQKPVKRRVPEVPSFGLIEKWSDGTLSDSESLLSYHFSTTKEIMWKMITSIETYNVWFYGIQRALPVLESERYVHKYSFNQLDLKPGSFFKIRPRTIAPYFKCRIMTFEYEKEFGFTFQTTPFSIEYVQFSLKTSKSGVIVHCSRVSSGGFSFLNQINWKEKSKIFNKLDEIIPKVKLVEEDSLKSEENTTTKKRIVAPSLSKDDIVAVLVNKVLDGNTEAMDIEKSKVIRGKAKAMIVKIKRGSAERPPMPKVPTSEPSSTGNVESLSKENQIALYVNKGLDGDMDSINNLQDKVIRAKVKAMIVKIKRGSAERPSLPLIDNNSSKNEAESVNEKIIRLVSNGIKGEMDEINSLKDPILKGKIKASIMKEKRKQK